MEILLWIFVGIVAGSVARLLMPGPAAGGMGVAIVVAVAGAVIGGMLRAVFNEGAVVGFDALSLVMATIGAMTVMFCYRSYAMRLTL